MVQITVVFFNALVFAVLASAHAPKLPNPIAIAQGLLRVRGSTPSSSAIAASPTLHPFLESCKADISGTPPTVVFNADGSADLSGLSSTCMSGIQELEANKKVNGPAKGESDVPVNVTVTDAAGVHIGAEIPATLKTVLQKMQAQGGN
jgi:hypothetical protein